MLNITNLVLHNQFSQRKDSTSNENEHRGAWKTRTGSVRTFADSVAMNEQVEFETLTHLRCG